MIDLQGEKSRNSPWELLALKCLRTLQENSQGWKFDLVNNVIALRTRVYDLRCKKCKEQYFVTQ